MIGSRLGAFEIRDSLGEGGMGVVYRAEDTRLGREVAIKVLPEELVGEPDRLARFEREARLLASLNHPNIATVHEVGVDDGIHFLVMELVEGETLADRVARSALDSGEATSLALQIARALEAAHAQGVVHRDLKPANVVITEDGVAKVLDFGLAKAMESSGAPGDARLSQSPTLTAHATTPGVILGTAAYMAPEQARGGSVDRRADIWAFGAVLREMLTGRRLFDEDTVSDTLAAVLKDGLELDDLPAGTPPVLRYLLARCLERDPRRRLQEIGEARVLLEEPDAWPMPVPGDADGSGRRETVWPWLIALAAVAVLAALGTVLLMPGSGSEDTETPALERFEVMTESIVRLDGPPPLDLSSGARTLVWIARGEPYQLMRRSLSAREPERIPGTEGALGAVAISPDGGWVLFSQGRQLKKLNLATGAVIPVCSIKAPLTAGAGWSPDGSRIVFADFEPGVGPSIKRISADGGDPEMLVQGGDGVVYAWPSFLSGNAILYFSVQQSGLAPSPDRGTIEALDLETGERVSLLEGAAYPSPLPNGHVAAVDGEGRLVVFPVDPQALSRTGPPLTLAEGIAPHRGLHYRTASDGTLARLVGLTRGGERLEWIDRTGRGRSASEIEREFEEFQSPRLSPDGHFAAVLIQRANLLEPWRLDLVRDVSIRLLQDVVAAEPVWSPEGDRIAIGFFDVEERRRLLRILRADGGGEGVTVWQGKEGQKDRDEEAETDLVVWPKDWSKDDLLVLEETTNPNVPGAFRIGLTKPEAGSAIEILVDSTGGDFDPRFSPDGRWLSFTSNRSGDWEVYLQRIDGGVAHRVSPRGGSRARWNPLGGELFYLDGEGRMVAVPITLGESAPEIGTQEILFPLETHGEGFDVASDGEEFLMVREAERGLPRLEITRTLPRELERLGAVATSPP